jgi:hypothetical protein
MGKHQNALNTGNPSYAIEKIGDWIRQSGTGAFTGDVPIKMLRQSLDAFAAAIEDSDPNDDFIKHDVPLVRYTLDELEKYINRQQSDVKSDSGAQIYHYFLQRQWQEFKEMAQERDGE